MQRYHFNLRNGFKELDDIGLVYADVEQARLAAVRYAGELLKDQPRVLLQDHGLHVVVADDQDKPVYRVSVSAGVPTIVAE